MLWVLLLDWYDAMCLKWGKVKLHGLMGMGKENTYVMISNV